MAKPRLPQETIEAIKGAPSTETHEALAERLEVSIAVVRKYRREARHDRQEVAREVVARHVEENIPDALADLTALRQKARTAYENTGDSRDGKLWLDAIKTTLDHVKPDDSALDDAIEAELARVADAGQSPAVAAAPRASRAGVGAVH
ncbi:MAG: hypothetical protein ACO1SX_27195 [Actinomycetota bacterium]